MNKKMSSKKRLAVFLIVVGLLLIACLGRAVYLVVKKGDIYHHKALAQATSSGTVISAQPGNIFDRNGTALAVTKRVYRLILDPKVLSKTEEMFAGSREKTVEIAAEAFGLDKNELMTEFLEKEDLSYVRYQGNTILSEEEVAHYQDMVDAFVKEKNEHNKQTDVKNMKITARVAGIWFEEEYRREYPLGNVLSKVVGYTTKDAKNGIMGLELSYDDVLRGEDGKQYTYIDENGDVTTEMVEAKDGYSIVTSLDSYVAEKVKECIDKFNEETGGHRINVLVMDVTNGEVLAMESDTELDLNDPTNISHLFTEEELENPADTFLLQEAFKGRMDQLLSMTKEEQLEALLQQVQINYSITGTYEPGSTSKAITLAAAYEEGKLDNEDTFWCDGGIPVENFTIHCHSETLCGWLNPYEALGRSCNVCFVQFGRLIGAENMEKYQEIFNLGQKTNIDLPGEANTSALLYYGDNMGDIELATCSFGQSYNVTMLQFAAAYMSLLNGGYYYQPHIVTEIRDLSGNTVRTVEPKLVRRTISEETSEYIRGALRFVVTNGTGGGANIQGYTIAGKTGAAEKLPRGTGKYVISFISTCPVDDPKYLIYVTIDEPKVEDQSISAPAQFLARDCWEALFSYLNIYPESDPDAYTYDWSLYQNFSGMNDSFGNGILEEAPQEN